jgi:hypothetical protein
MRVVRLLIVVLLLARPWPVAAVGAPYPLLTIDPAASLPTGSRPGEALHGVVPAHPRLSPRLDRARWELSQHHDAVSQREIARRHDLRLEAGRLQVVVDLARPESLGAPGDEIDLGGVALRLDRQIGSRLQAFVAPAELARLADAAGVLRVSEPIRPRPLEVISKGVKTMKADALHDLSIDGEGIFVGVLDAGFAGYTQLLGSELPAQVITNSFGTDLSGGGEAHGTAVAELVHDVAPGADLVLVSYGTTLDFEDAVGWLTANGVDIITTSTGSSLTGPCDGRDAMAAVANAAVDAGVTFLASAGNYGDGHHLGTFTPSARPGFEGYHAFTAQRVVAFFGMGDNCFGLPAGMPIDVSLVWDDWGNDPAELRPRADYDLYLMRYDPDAGWQFTDQFSDYDQQGSGYPYEVIQAVTPENGCYGLAVRQAHAERNHEFHLYAYNMTFAKPFQVPERSVIDPCVGEKVQCIGATTIYDSLAQYSSRGPANPDERTGEALQKPDFVAPAGTKTATYGGFSGTSASAPHAAGAFALLLQLTGRDHDLALAMARELAKDLGSDGPDPQFGWGRVELAACTATSCDDHLACTPDACTPSTGCTVDAPPEGCLVDATCYGPGAPNAANGCLVCDPAAPFAWSPAPDGSPCADESACTFGEACLAGACVGGAPVAEGVVETACATFTCDGLSGAAEAQTRPAGSPCGASPGCSDGWLTLADTCDGAGGCVVGGTLSCAPYARCADETTCASSCSGPDDCVPHQLCAEGVCVADLPPVADAGPRRQFAAAAAASLDGSASYDPEGQPLSFTWTQTTGTPVELTGADTASPSFTAPSPASNLTLRFGLRVHDGTRSSEPATTTVEISARPNRPPEADAGADQPVDEGAVVSLNGSGSSDPDGDKLSYTWSQAEGPLVTLDEPTLSRPSFTAPMVDGDALVTLELVVSDGLLASTPATVRITVRDLAPGDPGAEVVDTSEAPDAASGDAEADEALPGPDVVEPLPTADDDSPQGTRSGCAAGASHGVSNPSSGLLLVVAFAFVVRARRRARYSERA